jgi:hypothetical protein
MPRSTQSRAPGLGDTDTGSRVTGADPVTRRKWVTSPICGRRATVERMPNLWARRWGKPQRARQPKGLVWRYQEAQAVWVDE